jgi:Uma2 family endonuclease
MEIAPLVTAEEFEKHRPPDDDPYELVQGRIVRMSPPGFDHGRIAANVLLRIGSYVRQHDLGVVVTEIGVKLASNPDTVRGPDVAFVRKGRVPVPPESRRFLNEPVDLAVEVLSPDDRRSDVREKVDDYLSHGVPLVLVIDPATRTVTIHRRLTAPVTFVSDDDRIDLGDVIPGFSCTVREVFD